MSDHATTHDDHPASYVQLGPVKMRREYFMVLVVLSVLTVAEIGVTYLKIDRRVMGALLIGMALTKAAFVGLYYMHLKHEKRGLLWMAAIPLPLAGLYAVALMLDAHRLLRPITLPWVHH
jgi:cytochrome c oxidase subunit IV